MIEFRESSETIEIVSRMPLGSRIVIGLAGTIPLLAPYELFVRPGWEGSLSLAFLFALIISTGAVVVSGLFVFAAIAGLNAHMRFDAGDSVFTYVRSAPVLPLKSVSVPFGLIDRVEVAVHTWSEGPDTYSIRVVAADGRTFDSASSESRAEVEGHAEHIRSLLGRRGTAHAMMVATGS